MNKRHLELLYHEDTTVLKTIISGCQRAKHIQQVAYSTYHSALTQICFSCNMVRTSIKGEA